MRKIWLTAALAVILASCGGEKKSTSTAKEDKNASKTEIKSSTPALGQDPSEIDKMVNGYIKPFFDEEAAVTSRAVSPGESFEIYVFGGCSSLYTMSAAEFMLSLPEGVVITGEVKSDSTNITMGKADKDFMMAFKCLGGSKFMLMKYICRVNDSFRGGAVATREGSKMHFLGFTLCDEAKTMVKALGGAATLTRK